MTRGQHFLRSILTFAALCATSLLLTHFVERFNARKGPLAWVFGAIYLGVAGLWVADLLLSYRKVRYPCKGCNRLSAKLVKKSANVYFYECECGHREEAKNLSEA